MRLRQVLIYGATFLLASTALQAQTLNIAHGDAVSSIDPQLNNHAGDRSLALHLWDSIVQLRTGGRMEPGIAQSWKSIDPVTWEFTLRQNIQWQDGKPLTAKDIIFSLERAANVPGSLSSYKSAVRSIEKMEMRDPYTLIIRTKYPHPNLPIDLSAVYLVSEHITKNATSDDFNSGKAAVGSGPYRLRSFVFNDRAVLERNPQYHGTAPQWETVNYRYIADASARTAALLSGEVDVIDRVAVYDIDVLKKRPDVEVFSYPGLRVFLLQPSFHQGTHPDIRDHNGQPLAENPLLNPKVREALDLAIDRSLIVNKVMYQQAVVANQWMPKNTFGHNPNIPLTPANPEKAKQLLAEAGFPKGFQITIAVPAERYPQATDVVKAVAQFWSKIGVKTTVNAEPWSIYYGKANKNSYAMTMLAWETWTGEASYTLLHTLATYNTDSGQGVWNWGRYSNVQVDALLAQANKEFDAKQREQFLQEAAAIVAQDHGQFSLFHYNTIWAAKKGLKVEPLVSDRTTAMQVSGTKP